MTTDQIKLEFFRNVDDGMRVGHVYIEANDYEEAKQIFLDDIRESDVAMQEEYSFN